MAARRLLVGNNQQTGIQLGTISGTDQSYWLLHDHYRRHLYVLGVSGSGKTFLLSDLVLQSILSGYSGLAAIDFIGSFVPYVTEFLASGLTFHGQ